jgi:hypothetical protein
MQSPIQNLIVKLIESKIIGEFTHLSQTKVQGFNSETFDRYRTTIISNSKNWRWN